MFTYICTLYICKCSTLDKFYFGQCATLGGFYFGAGTGSGSTTSSSPVRNWPGGSLRARVRVWERGRGGGGFFWSRNVFKNVRRQFGNVFSACLSTAM